MKSAARIVLIYLSICLFLAGCKGKTKHEYFRHARLDSRHQLIGRYPVDSATAQNITCYHFIYDGKDRPVMVEYLRRGHPYRSHRFNVARIEIEYWTQWLILWVDCERWIYWSEDGDPARDKNGVNSFMLARTRGLKSISKQNRNVDNREVLGYEYRLDDYGRIVEEYTLDNYRRKFKLHLDVPKLLKKYDQNGNLIEVYKYGDSTSSVVKRRYKYDEHGNRVETEYLDRDNNPAASGKYGAPIVRRKYDANGYEIEESYHDEEGDLTEGKQGFAFIRRKFNDAGDVLAVKRFGVDGKLKERKDTGVAEIRYEYDEENNEMVRRYLGVDGQLVENKPTGVAVSRWVYNDQGKLTELSYYGVDGQLRDHYIEGYAIWRSEYDEHRFQIEEYWFDHQGELIENKDGYAIWRCKRDGNHRIIESSFYDRDNRLTKFMESEIATYTFKYDRWGNKIEGRVYGLDGKLVNGESGVAFYKARFERHGRLRWQRLYDKDGNLVKQ